jgi:hypothetical protein
MKNFIRVMIGIIVLLCIVVPGLAFYAFFMDKITFDQLVLVVVSITAASGSATVVAKKII